MLKVFVCIGSACHVRGSHNVISSFQQLIEEYNLHDKVDLSASFCLGHCQKQVSVAIEEEYFSVSPQEAREFFEKNILTRCNN